MTMWILPVSTHQVDPESTTNTAGTRDQKYVIWPQHAGDSGEAGLGISVGTNGVSVYGHASSFLPAVLS